MGLVHKQLIYLHWYRFVSFISVSGLINKRDENATEKILHINNSMKAVCVSRGWSFIDNA